MPLKHRERTRVHALATPLFSAEAIRRMTRPGYLAPDDVAENLGPFIRDPATEFFQVRNIAGHGPHLWDTSIASSQVACVNCFYPFIDQPQALKGILNGIFGDVDEALPIPLEVALPNGSTPYLTFEWIDVQHRLGESRRLQRGKYVTNVDVLLRYRTITGKVRLVLIEWKYCEEYSGKSKGKSTQVSNRGTDRLRKYRPHFSLVPCQIELKNGLQATDLMFHPFDQLMRLQLLATIYQRDREMDADEAVVLHTAPRCNEELHNVVHSPALQRVANSMYEAWRFVTKPGSFYSFATEDLIPLLTANAPNVATRDYLQLRYGGMA
jgi:hypothetical protein